MYICEYSLIRTLSNIASSMQENMTSFDIFKDINKLEETYKYQYHSSIKTTHINALSNIPTLQKWKTKNIPKYIMPTKYVFNFEKNKKKIDDKIKKSKYHPLDTVRISTKRAIFSKASVTEKYTSEIFLVKSIHRPVLEYEPLAYSLIDLRKGPIIGRFYSFELKKASFPHDIIIKSIIKHENNIYFVNVVGLPSSIVFKLRIDDLKNNMLSFRAKNDLNI